MKVLIVASRQWVQTDDTYFKYIIQALKESGHAIIFEHNYIPLSTLTENREKKYAFAKRFQKIRKSADVLIAEVSGRSIGVGFEISQAAAEKKPTLILYTKENLINVSGTVMETDSHRYITVKQYTKATIAKIINEFLRRAEEKLDTKFILIISPEIDAYLEWAALHKRTRKAQVVRKAVEKEMQDDDEYRRYVRGRK